MQETMPELFLKSLELKPRVPQMYKKWFKRRPWAIQVDSETQVGFRRALGGYLELPGYFVFSCWAPLGRFRVPFWSPLDFEGGLNASFFPRKTIKI